MEDQLEAEKAKRWIAAIVEALLITWTRTQLLLHAGCVSPNSVAAFLHISSN
jgi:hypothetical protein